MLSIFQFVMFFAFLSPAVSARLSHAQRHPKLFPQISFPVQFLHHNKMSSSLPLQIAETIQTASINHAPDPSHDLNPSTSASEKQPVTVSPHLSSSDDFLDKYAYDDDDEGIDDEDDEEIPYSVIRPLPRKAALPPLPDLRFEQSYLASIAHADTTAKVIFITIRDQVRCHLLAL